MTTGSTAAGWYVDAADPRLIRWWDGAAWTDHTQPNPSEPSEPILPVPVSASLASSAPVPVSAVPVSSAPYVPPPFDDPVPAEAPPGPRRSGTSLPISEPVRLVLPSAGALPPASATTPWTSTGTFAQPTGSVDLASVDYEPMTRTWGSGRGSGTQRPVTGVTTAGAWMLALSPALQVGLLALGWAVTEGGASAVTAVIAAALGGVAVLWIVLSAILDFRRLGALGHEFRPSVAWILLGPFFYLMARAIHVYRTTRRGTGPTWVFVALAVVAGAVVGVAVGVGGFFYAFA